VSGDRLTLERGAYLRRASPSDLDAILRIQSGLPMASPGQHETDSFLLGSDEGTYARMLALERMWLLVADDLPIGFTLTLADDLFRGSALWARRATIEWRPEFDADAELEGRVGYFDQLAVLPGLRSREWSACLALRALAELIDDEACERVLTTTVIEPISNHAALPYLEHPGARQIAALDEHYPKVGTIRSAMHLIEARGFWAYAESLAGARRPSIRQVVDGVARAAQSRDWRVLNPS
jgi:hypothetical protein